MEEEVQKAIRKYQCTGCVGGPALSCFEEGSALECGRHVAGTRISSVGRIFLGLPRGFNRLGPCEDMKLHILKEVGKNENETFGKFNIAVWKHLDVYGNTLVRAYSPRINTPFLWIFLGNHMKDIDCIEITKEDIEKMD